MRTNKVREIWQSGGAVINGWLGIPSSVAAENMAQAGWDSLTIDMQHGLVDYAAALTMLQAISTKDTTPLVRVPWNDPDPMQRMLDAGSYGIICPMINSRAECERFVANCRYAPRGHRSYGPARAAWYAGADYGQHANDSIITLAMIETQQALDNLEDILATPELDGIYVGPADLSLSMTGTVAADPTDPDVVAAIEHIAQRCKAHGIAPGIHCGTTEASKRMIAAGYQFISIASDNALLNRIARETVAAMRTTSADDAPRGLY
jgi:4-hydroxy-2-oxoheptanedioate aldolase